MLTDWLMVAITGVYVVATIMIGIIIGRSAKAAKEKIGAASDGKTINEAVKKLIN